MYSPVEDESVIDRIDFLRETNAYIKFLSCEPLIGPLKMNLENINRVIVDVKAEGKQDLYRNHGFGIFASNVQNKE